MMNLTNFAILIFVFISCSHGENCEKPCTRELEAVCGTNGELYEVFSNLCILRNRHCKDGKRWTQVRNSDCKDVDKYNLLNGIDIVCEKPCTKDYNPVCGHNGKSYEIFPNECVLRNQNCKDRQRWVLTQITHCDDNEGKIFFPED